MSLPETVKVPVLYADVIVDISHESLDRSFSYRVPVALRDKLQAGTRVWIPFGASNRRVEGYVIALKEETDYDPEKIKEILDIVPGSLSVESQLIRLADFLRSQYGSTMIQALKTVMPVRQKVKLRKEETVYLKLPEEEAGALLADWERKHYRARARLLSRLIGEKQLSAAEAVKECGLSRRDLGKLADQGIVELAASRRLPASQAGGIWDESVSLNQDQARIVTDFCSDFEQGLRRTYLLHGVTGSGKTEVYLALIGEVLKAGKEAIVLIPEISLTYQTVARFAARFGDRIAVIHSRMSAGERYGQIQRIESGQAQVVIGARSALFAPVRNLGLVIIDEEHDGAYKSDKSPKYHAREAAAFRADLAGASLVLGSATPSVESFARAQSGEYVLWTMKKRAGKGQLPQVRVVDLREEFAAGNRSVFSRDLAERIQKCLGRKEQIMLFLNRRGFAGFVSCRSCGQVIRCPHCDVSLTYHKNGSLRCHYCGYESRYQKICPHCKEPHVAAFGLGTEKVELAIEQEFPGARVLRMDADTTRGKDGHERILKAFARGDADILLGTQMIVKGHDYANVTLVGILAADLSLNSADFRSSEKTYQLLSQAAGRAGRGEKAGEVVIQTYSPDHYAITAAMHHSYDEFFHQEYVYRTMMQYPPCAHILVILIQSPDERQAILASQRIQKMILRSQENNRQAPAILNPGKAAIAKIKDVYRQVLYLKAADGALLNNIRSRLEPVLASHPLFAGISVQFDFDPMARY